MNSICVVTIAVFLLVSRQCQVALAQNGLKISRTCKSVADPTRRCSREYRDGYASESRSTCGSVYVPGGGSVGE
jgi:hypothetical protein